MINYYLLTKPGIIVGNLFTFAAGFLLASKGLFPIGLFLSTFIGLALIMASACVLNNYIDRDSDKKMVRTKDRPLAAGLISEQRAIFFAILLAIPGNLLLFFFTNFLTLFIANIGFFVYVVLYSFWKSRTVYGTAIGSIAGAVPPIVGYCAVSNQFDLGAFIFFMMMVLWQMPHFFSIAFNHFEDYKKAGIPVLPIYKGALRTKIHMVLYIIGFMIATSLLTLFHYTDYLFLLLTTSISFFWLALSIKGFTTKDTQFWGKQMFQVSLLAITLVCLLIPFTQ